MLIASVVGFVVIHTKPTCNQLKQTLDSSCCSSHFVEHFLVLLISLSREHQLIHLIKHFSFNLNTHIHTMKIRRLFLSQQHMLYTYSHYILLPQN